MGSETFAEPRAKAAKIAVCALGAAGIVAACLLAGRYPHPGFMNPADIKGDPLAATILFQARMPRVLAALFLGAVMAAAGNAFQLVFSNPLVEPGVLGVSQGASFGAALALVAGQGFLSPAPTGFPASGDMLTAVSAFAFALLGLFLTVRIARAFRFGGQVLRLVLSGIAVSAVFSSLLAILKYSADPQKVLPDIAYWTMGSISGMSWSRLALLAPVSALCLAGLYFLRWRMTLLSLDDRVAASLGVGHERERMVIVAVASAGVAVITSAAGIVSWIGLVVPHFARRFSGADARKSMGTCMVMGALFALACDTLSRSLFQGEIPLGATTALLGACAFSVMVSGGNLKVAR